MFSGEQAFMIGVDYFSDIVEYFRYAEYLFGKSKFEELDSDYKLHIRSIVLDKLIENGVIEDSRRDTYYSILEILDKNELELEYIIDDFSVCNYMQENAKAAIKISLEREVQSFGNRT